MKLTPFSIALATIWLCAGCVVRLPESSSTPTTPTSSEISASTASAEANFPDLQEAIHQGVNAFRRSQGLEPLTLEPILSEQARQHSEMMAQSGNLSHEGFDQRVDAIRQKLSVRSVAENVASNSGFDNPAQQAVEGWRDSPNHRQNMLGNYSRTGIGVAQTNDGEYYFTQIFSNP